MHRIASLILALLLSTLAACSDPPPPVVEEAILPDYSDIVCKPGVHPFWTKFRDAILTEDWEAVATLTEFPLTVHATNGGHKKLITRRDFNKQFPGFARIAPAGDYLGVMPKQRTMQELVVATVTLGKKACSDSAEQMEIDNWRFDLTPKGWRFNHIDVRNFPEALEPVPFVEQLLDDNSHQRCKTSVHPFWKNFRDAVLKEDWEAVAGLAEFPLTIHRFDGNEKLVARQDFARQFPPFLNATPDEDYPGVKPKSASMRALVKAVSVLEKKACGDFEIMLAIDNWQFFLRAEGWRLGRIDVHEFPVSMKHIPIQPPQIIKD